VTVILHASDVHFGKADPDIVERFLQEIEARKPDLVVLSGDFTQVGSEAEFEQAAHFIERITAPVFTIPGNHDVPRFNLYQRFFDPMRRYREFISPIEDTVYEDDDIHVVGINTARPIVPHWNWANGMVSQDQIQFVWNQFRYAHESKVRIFVCHHPLMNVESVPIDTIVWGSTDLLHILEEQHVDLVLTGHVHHASILPREEGLPPGPVMIGSASATSTRLREQKNGYNLIRIEPHKIHVDLIHWDGTAHSSFQSFEMSRALRGDIMDTEIL
jgi:3',5'-cyclic AMP phosphodiesterase CpdA